MSRLPRPCLRCGTPTTAGSLCGSCGNPRGVGRTTARGYGADWQRFRVQILARDGHRCYWCGAPADTVDHVVPLVRGGARLDPANCVSACVRCNSARTANLPPLA
jgi:5-methylcytosine-specific restriction endonuclease McrA